MLRGQMIQIKSLNFKKETKFFILMQILDIALTFFALRWTLADEMNPLGFTVELILFKFIVIISVAYIMEKFNFGKLIYLLLAVPVLVVIWNIVNIVFSFVYFR